MAISLYCEEQHFEDDEEESQSGSDFLLNYEKPINENNQSLFSSLLLEQDLYWEDEELHALFTKENEQRKNLNDVILECEFARRAGVEWVLKVHGYYGFSAVTAILAVDYFDRFISTVDIQKDKPWMIQLVAVTCLSLAAKVEETHVPLLLDLQIEGAKYVFEAKTIQKMELLVLATLQWRMNPVTPLSFLDHIIRRLGLNHHLHWEFLRRSELLLLSLVSDRRYVRYKPSVMATATMVEVIEQMEPYNAVEYQDLLLAVLRLTKEQVHDCIQLIHEISSTHDGHAHYKRKFTDDFITPNSPSGVIDAHLIIHRPSSSSSLLSSSSAASPSSSERPIKRTRVHEQCMPLPSVARVFLDVVASPR